MIPPLIGFFGKQQVLSAALDKGYVFLSLVAIITSVIGAIYYLNIIKEMFFYPSDYKLNNELRSLKPTISSYMSITISTITLIIMIFIVENQF